MSLIISKVFTYDEDAGDYIQRVEGASGDNQVLEPAVRQAINNFVIGCKQDGIWSNIEQCGILCGARTRAAAVIPLVKPAGNVNPTFHGTEGGWVYSRKGGLNGNGTNNYIDTKYVIPSGNQNNCHISINKPNATAGGSNPYYIGTATSGYGVIAALGNSGIYLLGGLILQSASAAGFNAVTRGSSSSVSILRPGQALSVVSDNTYTTPPTASMFLNAVNNGGTPGATQWSSAPLTFYSAGKNINLELLRDRVSSLMTAFATAIP